MAKEAKEIILNENNVIDIYKKLVDHQEVSNEEIEAVKRRFYELINV